MKPESAADSDLLCRPPLRGGGSTYCFTAVSVSVSVRSHPKAPPAQFFFGCTKI